MQQYFCGDYLMSALAINSVPIECINHAAIEYHVPATLIISVLKTENGRVGSANLNKNGTYDYGPFQVNSSWLSKIAPYGYTQQSLRYDPCVNVSVGTWILASEIASSQSLWQGIANYHSHTLFYNQPYQAKVEYTYDLLSQYLSSPSIK